MLLGVGQGVGNLAPATAENWGFGMLQPSRGRREEATRRSLTGWVVGFGCSVLADQVFFLSLAWAAVQLDVPGLVGLVLTAGALPRLLVLLLGAGLADTRSPKRIIIGTDSGRALIMAAAAAVLLTGSMNAWALAIVAVLVGTLDGFFLPAVGALPVRVAPPHLIGRVAALRTVTQRVGLLAGGPVAGWLIDLFGPSAAFFGSALLFALSVGSLALVTLTPLRSRDQPAKRHGEAGESRRVHQRRVGVLTRTRLEATRGFGILRDRPVLAGLLLLIGGMNFGFSGPFTAGIPLLAAAKGWGAGGAGLLIGVFGVGAAISGLGLLLRKRVPGAGLVQLAALVSMAVAITVVGVVPSLPVALAGGLVLGLSSGVFGTLAYALLLEATPPTEVGRVMALLSLTLESSAALSFLATGFLAPSLGTSATFLLGGLTIAAATLTAAARPQLRRLQMNPVEAEREQPSARPHHPPPRSELPAARPALASAASPRFPRVGPALGSTSVPAAPRPGHSRPRPGRRSRWT